MKPKKEARKLLIATDSFLPRWDGISRFLSEIIPDLNKDYNIRVLAPRFKGKVPSYKGVKIDRFPLMNIEFGDYVPAKPVFKHIKKAVKEADIVWVQSIGPIGAAAIWYAKRYEKKLIAYTHSVDWELVSESQTRYEIFKKFYKILIKIIARNLYNKCNLIMIPSNIIGKKYERRGIMTKKTLVHLGVDTQKFKPGDKEKAKKKIRIKPDITVIGFSGRLGLEKDLITLKRAFEELHKRYSDLRLLIVGQGHKSQMKELKGQGIILTGSKDNVIPYLQAMDIYVLPSMTETSSLSTMEAMSCGLAVVCTPVGHVRHYVNSGVNGLLFKKHDVEGLVSDLDTLINDGKLRSKFGKKARETIVNRYSWDKTLKRVKKVLGKF